MTQEFVHPPEGRTTPLPTTDATYVTRVLDDREKYYIYVKFLDSNRNTVAPTGGTITFSAGMLRNQFLEPSVGDGVINAAEAGPEADYTVVLFEGPVRYVRSVVSGITGNDLASMQILIVGTT